MQKKNKFNHLSSYGSNLSLSKDNDKPLGHLNWKVFPISRVSFPSKPDAVQISSGISSRIACNDLHLGGSIKLEHCRIQTYLKS